MDELFEVFAAGSSDLKTSDIPEFLCSGFQWPNKQKAVKDKQTRFAKYTDL